MSSPALTATKFRRWLSQQRPNRYFQTCDAHSCPVAAFLKTVRGRNVSVLVSTYKVPVKGSKVRSEHRTPAWAQRFILAVDRTNNWTISAKRARELLLQHGYRRA